MLSISKGILNAIKYAEAIDGNTLQIFLGSNQTLSLKMKTKITEEQICEVHTHLQKTKTILVIHTVYLLNFCNHPPTNPVIKYVLDNLIFDIRLTAKLGGIGCVLHIGYQKDLDEDEAYYNMVENVKYAIDKTRDCPNVKVILETPAGKGSQIGTKLEEFARIWNAFPKSYHSRLGICVDTAHIFSSGRCISSIKGTKDYFSDFDKQIGLKYLTLFHINDSKEDCHSCKDRHEGLGEGFIYGKEKGGDLLALKEIHTLSKKHNIPMVLETHGGGYYNAPKDEGKYAQEIALFRGWDKNEKPHLGFKLEVKPIPPPKKVKKSTSKTKTKHKTAKISKKSPSNQHIKRYEINTKIIDIFKQLSFYYNLEKNHIRKNAYDKSVFQLRRFPNEIKEGIQLKDIVGIGKNMMAKVDEIIKTNQLETLNKLKKLYDNQLDNEKIGSDLKTVLGFGEKKIKQLKTDFNIKNFDELTLFLSKNPKTVSNKLKLNTQQLIGIKYHRELSQKVVREEAEKMATKIKSILMKTNNKVIKDGKITVELAGSFASKLTKQSKDIDILIKSNKFKSKEVIEKTTLMKEIVKELTASKIVTDISSLGRTKLLGIARLNSKLPHRHIDMRLVGEEGYLFAKMYYTSGAMFNKMMRTVAKKNKFKLNEWGLYDFKGNRVDGLKGEKDIFKKIGMDFVILEERR